jgi:Phosphotransferase enzyme family
MSSRTQAANGGGPAVNAGPADNGTPTRPDGTGVEVWASQAWFALAVSWLDDQLAAAGIERTGEVEQPHLRPWATVLRAPTTRGPVWLKAAGPGTSTEIGLYELLHHVVPDRVLAPIATDVARGWMVLPDGGPTLGDRLFGPDLLSALVTVMPQYGQLQRDLASEADTLVALGVADMRAAIMPARFDQALAAVGASVERAGTEKERATFRRLAPLRDTYAGWCDELAGAAVAPSLDHNDLHAWNILGAGPDGTGPARFYDWGDSVVAHPFASMLVGLGFLHSYLEVSLDDPQLLRIRDAYLEVFSDLAAHAELVATLELACRVGKVARALTWERAVRALGEDAGEFAQAPVRSMFSLLDASHLGTP